MVLDHLLWFWFVTAYFFEIEMMMLITQALKKRKELVWIGTKSVSNWKATVGGDSWMSREAVLREKGSPTQRFQIDNKNGSLFSPLEL